MSPFSTVRTHLVASGLVFALAACADGPEGMLDPPGSPALTSAPTSGLPNEPADFLPITSRAFSMRASLPHAGVEGWDGSESRFPSFAIVTDDDPPSSPWDVAQTTFPAQLAGGRTPAVANSAPFEEYGFQSLFTRLTFKFSDDFLAHRSGVHALAFAWAGEQRAIRQGYYGSGSGPLAFFVRIPGARPHEALFANVPGQKGEISRGEWHQVDVLLGRNTFSPDGRGRPDGTLKVWIDGVLTHDYSGLPVLSRRTESFSRVSWAPSWGATGDGHVKQDMYIWLDHFYASGGSPANAPPVASIALSPNLLALDEDQTGGVTAVVTDVRGNVVAGPPLVWSSDDPQTASVSASGEVTGRRQGTTKVRATLGALSASIDVQVLEPARPGQNEPAGMSAITDRPFNSKAAFDSDRGNSACRGGSECWDGSESRSAWTIVQDLGAPGPGKSVARQVYPAGFRGGSSPQGEAQVSWSAALGYRTLYHRFWLKLSDNFYGHMTATNKIFHMWGPTGNILYYSANGTGSGPLQFTVRLQGIPDAQRVYPPNIAGRTNTVMERGEWHIFETLLTMNSPGQTDGSFKVWQDGRLTHDYSGRELLGAMVGSPFWWQAQWSPTWGGGDDVVPAEMSMWLDDVYISGAP